MLSVKSPSTAGSWPDPRVQWQSSRQVELLDSTSRLEAWFRLHSETIGGSLHFASLAYHAGGNACINDLFGGA